jgi:hypothetical protein
MILVLPSEIVSYATGTAGLHTLGLNGRECLSSGSDGESGCEACNDRGTHVVLYCVVIKMSSERVRLKRLFCFDFPGGCRQVESFARRRYFLE